MGVLAACHAAPAEDTFGSIPHQSRSQLIEKGLGMYAGKGVISCTGKLCHMQQLAVFVLLALLTVLVMIGQQQLYAGTSCFYCFRRGDPNLHSLGNGIYATGHQASCAGGFYQAHPAGAQVTLSVIEGTKGRDLVSAGLCCLQYGHSLFHFVRDTFDFNVDLRHSLLLPYCLEMALIRQVLMQAPHLIHFDVSMV